MRTPEIAEIIKATATAVNVVASVMFDLLLASDTEIINHLCQVLLSNNFQSV